nr:unnamed protein product [Callosobruchus analis]
MSDTSNDNDSSPERSLKRRKKQPHEWKQNKRKQARLRGEEYVSTSGKTISRKMVGEISSCSDKCTEQILQDEKQAILSKLYEMKSKDQQDTYLMGLMELIKPNMNPQIPIEKAYQEAVPIHTKKIADLKQLLPYFFDETLEFYYHIISWKVKNEDSSEK